MIRHGVAPTALAVAMIFLGPAASRAGDAKQQAATAAAHAGMAAAASEPEMVKAYLQHAVNCLTGPAGEGYDSTQANPCKDQGFGAMQDAPMDQIPLLRTIVRNARAGLTAPDIERTRAAATNTQTALGRLKL